MDFEVGLVDLRHSWLLERVDTERRIMTNEAAAELGVSVDTIRRDLRLLHKRGLLKRVHGGAVPVSRLPASFSGRSSDPSAASALIAAEIAGRFESGQVIGLDGGSTCVEIARMIPSTVTAMVVTNNPAAVVALADHGSVTAILLGGRVDLNWMATTGADTVDGWRNYRLDVGVLGVCGLDGEIGVTTNSADEVATKRALIAAASEVVVPIQAEKIGTQAPLVVAPLEALSTVVADVALPPQLKRALTSHGAEVVVVDQ